MRNTLINTGIVLATILIFFFGIEAMLRITGLEKGRPVPPQIYKNHPDPRIGYALKPNLNVREFRSTVKTNSMGFRSPELDPQKPTIAILGDSIAFGYGLENDETIAANLQKLLEYRFNVLNTAAPGYNLQQETAIYQSHVASLKPAMVMLIFHFNDLEFQEPASVAEDGNLVPKGTNSTGPSCRPIEEGLLSAVPGRCWLDLHSAFYRAVKKIVSRRTEQRNLATQEKEYRTSGFEEDVTDSELEEYRKTLHAFATTLPPSLPRLFVLWPEKKLHMITRPKLKALVTAEGFPVLDLYEVFGNSAETLSWDTVHPSKNSAAEAAGIIKQAMEHWKLLP